MTKDKAIEGDAPQFEPPAIRVLARFEQITLSGGSSTMADMSGFDKPMP